MDDKTTDTGLPVIDTVEGGTVGDGVRPSGDGPERAVDSKPASGVTPVRGANAGGRAALVAQARVLFEAGKSPKEIARATGISDRKIRLLAAEHGWTTEAYAAVVAALNDNRDNIKRRLLMKIIAGQSPELAAKSIGVTRHDLDMLRADDPSFETHVVACRAEFLGGQEAKIADAPDWRAALEILKRAKETKEGWSAPEHQRAVVHIELNVPRGTKDGY